MKNQKILLKAQSIKSSREKASINDSLEFQKKRENFIGWLLVNYGEPLKIEKVPVKYGGGFNHFSTEDVVMTREMYFQENDDPIKSKWNIPQYPNKFHNTRKKIPTESCLEVDKLPFEKMMFLIGETIAALIRKNIHFAVFYAKGQRSPHIRIYDFEELNEMNPRQRIKAQIQFWRKHVPFGLFQFVDTGLFVDDHPMQLEFAPHWKYNSIFNLLFEYPFLEVEECKI